jgi:hypothetical protein
MNADGKSHAAVNPMMELNKQAAGTSSLAPAKSPALESGDLQPGQK